MNIPWKIKSAIFRIIEVTNATQSLSFFQKFVTRRAFIKVSKVNPAWLLHEEVLLKFDSTKYVLEVGAGQSLIQNLYLSKICDRQLVIDLFPILDLSAVSRAVKFLFSIGRLNSLEAVRVQADLRNYGLEYRAPCELKDLTLEIDKFDAIISTDTFEHIPFSELRLILDDLKKVLKPSGILSVCIDYSDHYSHTDKSISDLNFLKYSDDEWTKYNHRHHFQNRARHNDYRELFLEAGFSIAVDRVLACSQSKSLEYSGYSQEKKDDAFATAGFFVLRPW